MPDQVDKSASGRSPLAVEYVAISVVVAAFLAGVLISSFLCDDAFITFRYAKNLAVGHGPVYNIGEHVEGYTNFLWMFLMSVVIRLGGTPELWSRIVSIICSCGTVLLLYTRCWRLTDNLWARLLFPSLLALSAPFIIWSTGGLETSLVSFLSISAVLASLRANEEGSARQAAVSGALVALAILTRPDSAIFALLIGLYFLLLAMKGKMRLPSFGAYLLPLAAIVGTHVLWRWFYYGKLLPNTFYIKSPALNYLPFGLRYLGQFALESALWFPILMVAYTVWRNGKIRVDSNILFLLSLVLVFCAWVIYTGGDFMVMGRFFVPILAIAYLLFAQVSAPSWPSGRATLGIAAAILVAHIAYSAYMIGETLKVAYPSGLESVGLLSSYRENWTKTGNLLKRIAQPTDTIMTSAAGIIPYYSELHTIDALALTAPDLNSYRTRPDAQRPGHARSLKPEALAKALPQFLIGHPSIAPEDSIYFNFSTLADAKRLVMENYYPVSMSLTEGSRIHLFFFLRKDLIDRYGEQISVYKITPTPLKK